MTRVLRYAGNSGASREYLPVDSYYAEFVADRNAAVHWVAAGESEQVAIAPPRASVSRAVALLDSWLQDESGYDEATWPLLKEALGRDRLSNRPVFDDTNSTA